MPRKSNKTSYVMNLITNGEEEQGQEGQSGQALQNEQGVQPAQDSQNAQNIQAAAQNAPAAPISGSGASPEADIKKVVVVDEDQESERLSEEIKGQLELQLEAELKEQAEAAEKAAELQGPELQRQGSQRAEPLSQDSAAAYTAPSAEQEQLQPSQEPGQPSRTAETEKQEPTEILDAKTAVKDMVSVDTETTKTEIAEPTMDTEMNTATETMDTTADVTAAAETLNTTTQPTQPSQSGYRMVNVMETLVARVDLDKYIKEYDVCPCPRCRADVHALILTTLPSKYVVMDDNSVSLMLNFYESRRKTDIFTATLKACLEVKEHPRHNGEAAK